MTNFFVFIPHHGIAPRNRWLVVISLKDCKLYDNKNKRNGSKIILGDFNYTMNEMDRDGKNKTRRIDRCRSNYSNYSHYDRSYSTRTRIDRVYTDIKIADNTKINYKMVSFTDH